LGKSQVVGTLPLPQKAFWVAAIDKEHDVEFTKIINSFYQSINLLSPPPPAAKRQPYVMAMSFCLSVRSSVCRQCVLIGHWPDWPSSEIDSAGGRERPQRCWASGGGGLSYSV